MTHSLMCLFTWLTFLGVIISTPLYLCGFMENALIPIFTAITFPPLAGITLFLERRRRQNPATHETDTDSERIEESHGSKNDDKAQGILDRILTKIHVLVEVDGDNLEVHLVTLDGNNYYHLQPRCNGGYIIELAPTNEVQRIVDIVNKREAGKNTD